MPTTYDPTVLDAMWSSASSLHHPTATRTGGARRRSVRRRLAIGVAASVVVAVVVAALVAGGSPGAAIGPGPGTTVAVGGWSRVDVTLPLADGTEAICYEDQRGALTCARTTEDGRAATGLAALDVVCGQVPGAPACAVSPVPEA